jgi:hypothetical protein
MRDIVSEGRVTPNNSGTCWVINPPMIARAHRCGWRTDAIAESRFVPAGRR